MLWSWKCRAKGQDWQDAFPGGGGDDVATLAFIAASGLMNWVFMTSLGKSEFEQQIFGSVSVAVSVFIALLPTLILWAWRERRFLYVALGVPDFSPLSRFHCPRRSALPPKIAAH